MGRVDNRKLSRKSLCEQLPLPARDENFPSLLSYQKLWVALVHEVGSQSRSGKRQSLLLACARAGSGESGRRRGDASAAADAAASTDGAPRAAHGRDGVPDAEQPAVDVGGVAADCEANALSGPPVATPAATGDGRHHHHRRRPCRGPPPHVRETPSTRPSRLRGAPP